MLSLLRDADEAKQAYVQYQRWSCRLISSLWQRVFKFKHNSSKTHHTLIGWVNIYFLPNSVLCSPCSLLLACVKLMNNEICQKLGLADDRLARRRDNNSILNSLLYFTTIYIYIYVTSARTHVTHTKETIYLALLFAIYFRYFEFLHCETNSLKSFKWCECETFRLQL